MKVLVVCTVPTERSGIPCVIFNLWEYINDNSITFGYVSINDPIPEYKYRLKKMNINFYIIPRKLSNPLIYVSKLSDIARNYDIMHVHGNSATMVLEMIAAKIAGVKIRIAHSHNTTCSIKLLDKILRPIFYSLCNVRLACGIEAGRWLFRKRGFTIINNGIDSDKYKFNIKEREYVREILKIKDEKVIGHIGNFNSQKNHKFLISIFKEFHKKDVSSKLLLLGDGSLKNEIQKEVESEGLADSVIFVGSVDNPKAYMCAMDLVIMPSLFEGLPLAMIEEQANGLSILAANTITTDANISGDVIYFSLENSPEDWASKALDILDNKKRILTTSLINISKIKKAGYDINIVANDLMNSYKCLLNNK